MTWEQKSLIFLGELHSKPTGSSREKLSGFSPFLPKFCLDEENQEEEGTEQQHWCLDGCWGGALGSKAHPRGSDHSSPIPLSTIPNWKPELRNTHREGTAQ